MQIRTDTYTYTYAYTHTHICTHYICDQLICKTRSVCKFNSNQIRLDSNTCIFAIFIFRVMVIFVLKMTPIFDEFSPIT